MSEISVHKVTSVELGEVVVAGSVTVVRSIYLTRADGSVMTIKLFADKSTDELKVDLKA